MDKTEIDYRVIHVYGASGSGTSTIGEAVEKQFQYFHMDSDDYYWLPTNPPFGESRDIAERIRLMKKDIADHEKVIITGSLVDWGDPLIPCFDLAIRVVTDTAVRLKRLEEREYKRFGERIRPGGDMYEEHEKFIKWAGNYDTGNITMRSKSNHDYWERLLSCPKITVDGAMPIEKIMKEIFKPHV